MILLSHESNEDRALEAWECFRRALDILLQAVGELHPKVAYAYDRLGYVRQLRGDVREAERLYLRSIAIRDVGRWAPTMWDELTFLNLAVLYGRQGRHALQHVMIRRRREAEAMGKPRLSADELLGLIGGSNSAPITHQGRRAQAGCPQDVGDGSDGRPA
jgi:tetratricopeptide (TPR) repeat protein